jgi:hypothetical protein
MKASNYNRSNTFDRHLRQIVFDNIKYRLNHPFKINIATTISYYPAILC